MRKPTYVIPAAVLVATLYGVTVSYAAGSVCDSRKLKASAKIAYSELVCHAKATKNGSPVDGTCLSRARDKFDAAFIKAEAGSDCGTVGGRALVRATIVRYLDALVSSLRPSATASRCASKKLAEAGRDAKSTFTCQARAFKRDGVADSGCSLEPREKLIAAFRVAEARQQPCLTSGDGSATGSSIAELVSCVLDSSATSCPPPSMNLYGGRWGGLITLRRQGLFVTPVHATLLSDGRVLFFGYAKTDRLNGDATTQYYLSFVIEVPPDPGAAAQSEVEVSPLAEAPRAVDESVWCAGHAPTDDGRIFTAGGTRFDAGVVPRDGIAYTQILSGSGPTWSRLPGDPTMKGGNRWYPTVTKLPPPTPGAATPMLITTGLYTVSDNDPNRSVEIFDPQAGDYRLLAAASESPHGIAPKDYTHVFLLPLPGVGSFVRDEVLMFGRYGDVYGFNYSDATLGGTARFSSRTARPNDRVVGGRGADGASTVMLRDGRVMMVGGANSTAGAVQADLLRGADIYDPRNNVWRERIDTGYQREDAATVLLPDGRVLVINGVPKSSNAANPIPQLIDPSVEPPNIVDGPVQPPDPFVDSGDNRGYHNVALLLPDARVLVGGGRDNAKRGPGHWERPDVRFFYPYRNDARPEIGDLPSNAVAYGQPFEIPYSRGPITRVTLLALGSMTHDVDMNQRHVELAIESTTTAVVRVVGPSTRFVAPPGHYMLFVLDSAGTPCVARIIRLS